MVSVNVLGLIGNTPMLRLEGIYAKPEFLNPSGSIKDRIAKYIVEKAEKTGKLKKGYTIIEATSGNTGIAFSMVAAVKGYNMIAVMPKGMSIERQEIMHAYGAAIHFVDAGCVSCAVDYAGEYSKKEGFYHPDQFSNEWNVEENENVLGQEILRQLEELRVKKIDAIVVGIGTGGTLIGVGRAVRKEFPKARLFGVEPAECPIISECIGHTHALKHKICSRHKIEGIGDGFIPEIILRNRGMIDKIIKIKSGEAILEARRISRTYGLLVGISSGANLLAAQEVKKEYNLKNVVTFFPDSGSRYLSEHYF